MSLKIFYGVSGTGKTTKMLDLIAEYAKAGKECVLFVPEQFSFDAERQVYFAAGAQNVRHVLVTGFSKLSRNILKEYKQAKPVADDAVKLVTMWLSVEKVKKDFSYFNIQTATPAFCRLMLKTVAALRNGGVSPENLNAFLSTETALDTELSDKTEDILKIYAEYDRTLTENLDDKLDDVSKAAVISEQHNYFKDKYLFFDNFDTFSEVQKKLLATAIKQCSESVFCFTTDKLESAKREFLCVSRTVDQVKNLSADFLGVNFPNAYRAAKREKDPIEVYAAKDYYTEASLIAAKIHNIISEKDYRYRDFLVLTPDSDHEPIITSALKASGIPVFSDFPRPMTEKPVIGFILQIFKSLEFDTEEILKLVESGFKRIRDEEDGAVRLMFNSEIYRLRLAAEQYGLRAEDWQKDWSKDKEPRKKLNGLEAIRRGIAEPLAELKENLEKAENGAEMSKIFMTYLLENEKITATFIAGSKAGKGGETHNIEIDENAARENDRIWDALIEALTSMAYTLKEEKITYREYREILEEILSGINLANPPDVLDSVTVGDIERTRKSEPKVVFIAGVNQGNIPRESTLQSAFSYFEREKLCQTGLPIYDSNLNRWSKEYYFAYRAMNLYGKKLILTYSSQKPDGREQEPADILNELPKAVNADSIPKYYFLNTAEDVRTAISENFGNKRLTDMLEDVLNKAEAERAGKDFREKLSESETLLSGKREFSLSPDIAEKLFDADSYSPTRLSTAFDCPFEYFLRYGLYIKEPDSSDLEDIRNMGTAIHNILKIALSQNKDIAQKSNAEIEEIARSAVGQAMEYAIKTDPTFPLKTEAVYKGYISRVEKLLEQISLELKTTGFVPMGFEERLKYEIEDMKLPKGKIVIEGTADRIDLLTSDKNALKYIRICDYKNSERSFTEEGIECGKNLQPLLYLFGKCKDNRFTPAAAKYSAVGAAQCLKTENSLPPARIELEKAWYKNHKETGAILESEILEGTGAVKGAKNIDLTEFENLKQYIGENLIVPKITEIMNGNISAAPLEFEGTVPCDYCEFKVLCGKKNALPAEDSKDLDNSV